MVLADNKQKGRIKMLQKLLGYSDDEYREILWHGFNVDSSKKLSIHQARELIRDFEVQADKRGLLKRRKPSENRWKYNHLGRREGYASPAQLRMLNAMWHTSDKVREKTDKAFENFICRICKVEKLEWLKTKDVNKAKIAIESLV